MMVSNIGLNHTYSNRSGIHEQSVVLHPSVSVSGGLVSLAKGMPRLASGLILIRT
ncbi:hypothetical protein DFA_03069 [Cavenderia fasciculata]|uniref:Uncharacterized protein n=1 Tax=Cavenderia fasciculata TaxID=261658 RepID=F4PGJ0_CACFS|nr:uncharacterized protein DFA_03069 [Cavenderia fasciculata]EGG24824.1 hypothetical protein DFA_03069 [Cavenderia fasciculata]|eukprot:XP_004362675.1 hypothetical protein DFA_03069 [Cavenderia fasciculata]